MVLCSDGHITPAHLMFDDWLTHTLANSPSPANEGMHPARGFPLDESSGSAINTSAPATTNADADTNANAAPLPDPALFPVATGGALPPFGYAHTVAAPSGNTDLQSAVRLNEHQMIMATLASTPSKTEAAKRLGISPRTLRYKMAQLREHGLALGNASAAF
jgi:two-component system response regulator FlrC